MHAAGWRRAVAESSEIGALVNHSVSVVICLGVDALVKWVAPAADVAHPASVWLHRVLDWGAVALVAALTWHCLMLVLTGAVEATRGVWRKRR